ncbi:MAG: flagellar hook-basal body complex protein FliE [Gammaproteobacteria bacterium]|nr:MAG: flagellar hook-basal body complex protein FliE [Gammaproteobacteria bacterium]
MNEIDMNQILSQMRALSGRIEGLEQPVTKAEEPGGFRELLDKAVDQVNETQQQANRLATAFQQGDPEVDLAEVMLASQKASLSFKALSEVRNKLVTAYQEIMNMPV